MSEIKIEKQKEFPFINEYRDLFPITDDTIFVFKDKIFTNNELPYDIVHHEIQHLKQQQKIGATQWIDNYLHDKEFRLKQELEAYIVQLQEVKKMGDKNELFEITAECARNISSPLYGNMIKYQKALKILTNI